MDSFAKFKRGINLANIEDSAYVIRSFVDSGAKLPCADGATSGLLSGGSELTCAQAKAYCSDASWKQLLASSCPMTATRLVAIGRRSGGYADPTSAAVTTTTTTTVAQECVDGASSGLTSGGSTLACSQVKNYCSHGGYGSFVSSNCPVTCQKAKAGRLLPGAVTTTATTATATTTATTTTPAAAEAAAAAVAASAATATTIMTTITTTTTTTTTIMTTTTTTTTTTATAAQECVDGASSGVRSSGGSRLACSQVKAYCSHGTHGSLISSNCPVTCRKAKAGCFPPAATCEDGSTSGVTSSGRALTCSQVTSYCNHDSYGSFITGNCPKSCGACS
ncbi:unnamed protein product [Polarella glacialis]|uniref:ShKT domain-containing protein n=1 Tax=Polarella glacialis TaxID=89957 RepID=A0A813G3R5_POLGL|nr:unnamed protein product [Polarella glacialis]